MKLSEFHLYKEETFDSYIKKVIKNAAIDANRSIANHADREISLTQLSRENEAQLAEEDTYDLDSVRFSVRGDAVTVNDIHLGQAIASLSPQRREVILLSYFMDKNDPQVADLLHMETNTVRYRKHAALRRLRRLLEELDNGK